MIGRHLIKQTALDWQTAKNKQTDAAFIAEAAKKYAMNPTELVKVLENPDYYVRLGFK